jgi:hypothetical protein
VMLTCRVLVARPCPWRVAPPECTVICAARTGSPL